MVHSCRHRRFDLYVDCLEAMVPLFFATSYQHYSRWLTVHLHDLRKLSQSIKNEFEKSNFVVTRSPRRFSAIPVDQAHEQNNKVIKGCGGVIDSQHFLTQWKNSWLVRPKSAVFSVSSRTNISSKTMMIWVIILKPPVIRESSWWCVQFGTFYGWTRKPLPGIFH